jgi:4a-hydroxytetrahydrobiopterin dehydratase
MSHTLPDGWKEQNNSLQKIFRFGNFPATLSFMVRVGYECEKMNHHPEWKNTYNILEVVLKTHDAGDIITEKDILLAKKMNELYDTL